MPSTQSSFRPRWTTFTFHVYIADTDAPSLGPSKIPQPRIQANPGPE
jgi:hypothetical protein